MYKIYNQIRPSKKQQLKDTIKAIRLIRGLGKDIINERLNTIKNNEHFQTDILAGILNNWGKIFIENEMEKSNFIIYLLNL